MHNVLQRIMRIPSRIALFALRFYQKFISPMLGPTCRFYPSCSQYAVEAIRGHGLLRGGMYTTVRLCKCHPFHPGGVDMVPESDKPKEDTV